MVHLASVPKIKAPQAYDIPLELSWAHTLLAIISDISYEIFVISIHFIVGPIASL